MPEIPIARPPPPSCNLSPCRKPSHPPPTGCALHLWQIQPVRNALVIAVVLAVLWMGYKLSLVTVPLLIAMALAYLLNPWSPISHAANS